MKLYKTVGTIVCCLQLATLCLQPVVSVTIEEISDLRRVFQEIQAENSKLSSECDFLKQENSKLWTEVNRLVSEVKELQQYTRLDNVEIAGIPQRSGEDLYEILEKIASALGIPYRRDDISEAHRLPKGKQGYPFIIVRFISRRYRDQWLSASKARQCNIQQIFGDAPTSLFFVNQHLTSYKKGLLDMAKRLVNEGVYTFAWVKDGKVYVRRTPTSEVIRIKTFEDFEQSLDNLSTPDPDLYN